MTKKILLSALVVARNEEKRLLSCLEKLQFADEIVVVLDRSTDKSEEIAKKAGAKVLNGAWEIEGDRRNDGIAACSGEWILEVDADEHIPSLLAEEILATIKTTKFDWHEIPIHNYVGERLIKYGAGANFTAAASPRLSKKGVKIWGKQYVHPALTWKGEKGAMLKNAIDHYMDRNISDMIIRLDKYTTAKAKDLRKSGNIGSGLNNFRRIFSRFIKCYFFRKGYKEGGYGFLIALFAGLFPIISYFKAKYEKD
ncbi:MAG: glycosyltransferase family 2 protein [Alphaproteobacteria bacterium]